MLECIHLAFLTSYPVVDFLSDAMLVIFPLWLIRTTQIRRNRTKSLLIVIFCGSIVTLIVSTIYVALTQATKTHPDHFLIFIMMTHLQVCPPRLCH